MFKKPYFYLSINDGLIETDIEGTKNQILRLLLLIYQDNQRNDYATSIVLAAANFLDEARNNDWGVNYEVPENTTSQIRVDTDGYNCSGHQDDFKLLIAAGCKDNKKFESAILAFGLLIIQSKDPEVQKKIDFIKADGWSKYILQFIPQPVFTAVWRVVNFPGFVIMWTMSLIYVLYLIITEKNIRYRAVEIMAKHHTVNENIWNKSMIYHGLLYHPTVIFWGCIIWYLIARQ